MIWCEDHALVEMKMTSSESGSKGESWWRWAARNLGGGRWDDKTSCNERLDQQQLISNKTCTKKMATHRGFQGQVWMGVHTKKAGFQCSFVSSNLPVLDAKWFEKLSYDRWSVPTMRPRLWWTACIFFETWSDSEVGWFICKGKPSSQLLEINHEKVSIILNTSHLLRSTDEALEANHGSNGHGMPRHSEVASGPAISVCIFLKLGVFHCFPLFVFQLELFHFLMTIHHSNWKTPTTNPGVFRHIVWWVFPRMERETPAAWHLPGEANYGRLYEWHQFLPTRCLNLRGVTRRLQSQYFPPVLTEKMSQKEASEIYPWKGHPPKRKDVCVCVLMKEMC